jgi:uncharacterized protein (DUF1810 family)
VLDRFVPAQDRVWPAVMAELRGGRKATHWMWFVFPQLRGLGRSGTARFYGIADAAEAAAHAAHPVLGPRLAAAAEALLAHRGLEAADILGPVDAVKLRSSATLFAAVPGPAQDPMRRILARFHAGVPCPATMAALGAGG